jgi:tellurite resistance protein TerC
VKATRFCDVIFAVDSVPAIFAITGEPLIVFTSNVFAILGLRALYFLLAGVVNMFVYLQQGIAVVLVYVGVKMLIEKLMRIPTPVSLGMIAVVLVVAVAASLLAGRKKK